MANTIKLRRSATSGAIPTTSQLALGELAINTFDGKLFLKTDQSGTEAIVEVGGGGNITIASTTPSSPDVGDIYWDSNEGNPYIYYDDGNGAAQWVALVATAAASISDNISEGNTEAEVVDTGSNGHFKVTTEGTERLRVDTTGLELTGNYRSNVTAVTATDANGKHIIDCSAGNYFTKTISADEEFVFQNIPSNILYSFAVEIEVNGDRAITWPSSVKFNTTDGSAPTLTLDKTHLFMFVTDDGGTRFRAAVLKDYID